MNSKSHVALQNNPFVVPTPELWTAPKNKRRRERASTSKDPSKLGIVSQVREAMKPSARKATILGFFLGSIAPIATFTVARYELSTSTELYLQPLAYLVFGGMLFSALTVFGWGDKAFNSKWKALGWTTLIEGTMVLVQTPWLAAIALAYLVVINGIATGCRLSLTK
jgi:VIT1/CCC1 family predicted Fe2+/Mn2+ transporter